MKMMSKVFTTLALALLTGCGGYGHMQGSYLRGEDVSETGSGETYHGGALSMHLGMLLPETLQTVSPIGIGSSARVHVWDSGLSIPEVGMHTFIAIEPAGPVGLYLQGGGYLGLAYFDGLNLNATAYGEVGVFYAVREFERSGRKNREFYALSVSAESTWFTDHGDQIDTLAISLGVGGIGAFF